jgi:hydroxymethylpyrimidine pyrophosphatase-like HAD family hydrolase
MKYKMLVIDMDDTLLTDDHIISEENKEMLLKRRKGVYVILVGETNTSDDSLCQRIKTG